MKIVIVGGGTAGWLAALMISKIQKGSHDITVVDSSKIGIIGAGEGSTGYLTDIIQGNSWDYGCDEEDFIRETGATIKLGIEHKDWKYKGHSYYGPIDSSFSSNQLPDSLVCYAIKNNIPFHMTSENGYLIGKNKTNYWYEDNILKNTKAGAYHFDGHKVGQYFKKIANVKHIDSEVLNVNLNTDTGNIESLLLSNGNIIESDFFIDCSGFSRKLMSAVGMRWVSYQDNLPVNRAMPFLIDYKEDEDIKPVTLAWAQSAGWMWKIPTGDRYGCGYVYDDRFISDDQAKLEIESVLKQEITPIKYIKFETGRLDKVWNKNCLALGLSAAFAEPLEATSIHSTIVQLTAFIFDYLKDTKEETVNIGFQNIYNNRMNTMYDDFKDFLVLHYQTKRDDTLFWKYVGNETKTEFVSNILHLVNSKMPKGVDFRQFYGYAGSPLWTWILCGLGHINTNIAEKELKFYGRDETEIKDLWVLFQKNMEERSEKMISNKEFIQR